MSKRLRAIWLAITGKLTEQPQVKRVPFPKETLEAVAAISGDFHSSNLYDTWYTANADRVGGFPGIWDYCAEAGLAFSNAEIMLSDKLGTPLFEGELEGEYIDTVTKYTSVLLESEPLSYGELYQLAFKLFGEANPSLSDLI